MNSGVMKSLIASARGGRRALWDVVFPPHCLACRRPDDLPADESQLCRECSTALLREKNGRCPRCAMPAPAVATGDGKCGYCRSLRLSFQRATVLGGYDGFPRQLVLRIKHASHEPLAAALGRYLGREIRERGLDKNIDAVVCVPTHWANRMLRGYHAADTLGAAVARELGLPFRDDLLYCRRWAAKQSTLLSAERQQNVRGLFGVRRSYRLNDCRLLLVDDVITTGATAKAAAKTLRRQGAAEVIVAAVARGTGDV